MTEAFLILLAGGVLLAAAVANPNEVTLQWLRLAGIIALALSGLAMFFLLTRAGHGGKEVVLFATTVALILGQLTFVQVAWRKTQRTFALVGFTCAVAGATIVVQGVTSAQATSVPRG